MTGWLASGLWLAVFGCFVEPSFFLRTLVETRVPFLERRVLSRWPAFGVWGAGRDGKFFLNTLSADAVRWVIGGLFESWRSLIFAPVLIRRVTAIYDVDEHKIRTIGQYFHAATRRHIPIRHFSVAVPPFIVCVATKGRGGALEANIKSLGSLVEGVDYYYFA
jgi:hypothetical protein